jgi:tetratricopeptide (TPR) repeat protein
MSTTLRRTQQICCAALAVFGLSCASPDGAPVAPTETRDEYGFTITEEYRVGLGVRSDFSRAVELLEEEKYAEGIAALEEVTAAAPQATAAHIDLGIAYARVGELAKAEASIKKALELNPRHPAAYNELGIVYRRAGRFAEARKSYETALEIYPDFHFARRNLAILCDVYLRDPACAVENYEIYSRAVPEDETAAMWIADLRNRAGSKE